KTKCNTPNIHADHAHAHEAYDPEEPIDGPIPSESPWQMTLPLWILGGLSIVGGLLSASLIHIAPLEHFLAPVFQFATGEIGKPGPGVEMIEGAEKLEWPLVAPGVI